MFHKPYTYSELLEKLNSLTPQQLNQIATIYCEEEDEYYPISATATAKKETNDVLDDGHFYLSC